MERFRVLAVDDDIDTLELIRMTLKDEFEILTLSNPMEIYEFMEIFEPDVLLLDIMMPKLNGFQIIELMSKNQNFKNIPIIVLSAKDSVREIKYGYKLGIKLYLTKPFQTERLMKNVKMVLVENPSKKKKTFSVTQALTNIQLKQNYKLGTSSLTIKTQETTKTKIDINTTATAPKIPKISYMPDSYKNQTPAPPDGTNPSNPQSSEQNKKKDDDNENKSKTWVG